MGGHASACLRTGCQVHGKASWKAEGAIYLAHVCAHRGEDGMVKVVRVVSSGPQHAEDGMVKSRPSATRKDLTCCGTVQQQQWHSSSFFFMRADDRYPVYLLSSASCVRLLRFCHAGLEGLLPHDGLFDATNRCRSPTAPRVEALRRRCLPPPLLQSVGYV